jgi:Transglycosylase SLT domain
LKYTINLVILAIMILIGLSIGMIMIYSVKQQNTNRNITVLKTKIDSLSVYKEKELKLRNMEKALLICYDISSYEAHYYSIIYDDFATKYNIPWQIYPAIIRIESNFDPTLLSPKKAKGIAQVLDGTGKTIATKLGINYVPTETLWNDLLCQIIGFTYLSEAIKSKGLDNGVKCYIGGIGFDKGRKDIGEYRTTVLKEFEKLKYIYLGVVKEGELK